MNASEEGKLYGSIGTREIADAASQAGHEIDKSEVELPEGALQETGEYDITITLSPEVSAEIKVALVATGSAPDAVEEMIEPEETEASSAEEAAADDSDEPQA